MNDPWHLYSPLPPLAPREAGHEDVFIPILEEGKLRPKEQTLVVYPEAPTLRTGPPVPQEMSQSPSAEKALPRWSWNHHFSLHSSSAF